MFRLVTLAEKGWNPIWNPMISPPFGSVLAGTGTLYVPPGALDEKGWGPMVSLPLWSLLAGTGTARCSVW
jgi:hypothetical protein